MIAASLLPAPAVAAVPLVAGGLDDLHRPGTQGPGLEFGEGHTPPG